MPDYSLSKIYKLVSNKTPDIYIGSCLMRLSTRLSTHKSKSNSCVSRKLFVEDAVVTIILIENFACNTKNELKARELHHITTNKCINVNKPFVCDIPYADTKAWKKEYNTINAEQISANRKEYYQANQKQISVNQNKYNKAHKEQINTRQKVYDEANKEHRKEYDKSHRDQISTRQRARYAEKKLALNLENNLNNNITV